MTTTANTPEITINPSNGQAYYAKKVTLQHVTLAGKVETRTTNRVYTHVVEAIGKTTSSTIWSWSGSAANAEKLAAGYRKQGIANVSVRPITPPATPDSKEETMSTTPKAAPKKVAASKATKAAVAEVAAAKIAERDAKAEVAKTDAKADADRRAAAKQAIADRDAEIIRLVAAGGNQKQVGEQFGLRAIGHILRRAGMTNPGRKGGKQYAKAIEIVKTTGDAIAVSYLLSELFGIDPAQVEADLAR